MECGQFSTRTDTFAAAGLGFPGNINKRDHASQSLPSGVYAAAVPPLILKIGFWSFKAAFSSCIMLIFATTFFRTTSAQGNFSIPGTSYDCSSNVICLGDAHVYTGPEFDNISSGSLSLLQENITLRKGIAYYHKPVRFLDPIANQSASFSTSFTIDSRVWANKTSAQDIGDGMTFVISADNSSLGNTGDYFGFFSNDSGIMPFKSIVVEFDIYMNNRSPFYDISNNHVSFEFANVTWAAVANASDVNVSLDQRTVYACVDYSSDTKQLEARISYTNFRPTSPLLNFPVNLFDVVDAHIAE